MSLPQQVYVINHKQESRTTLAYLLQGQGMGVHAFSSVPTFLQWINYDSVPKQACVVTDVDMPEMNGIDLYNVFNADEVSIPMVFIEGEDNKTDTSMLVNSSGSIPLSLIKRPFKDDKLVDIIKTLLVEKKKIGPEDNTVSTDNSQTIQQRITALSTRELEVLAYVFEGKLNKLIADRLQISIKTVEMHRANMMQKMGAKSIIDLIKMLAFNGGVPKLHH